jgi:hypothetical protein
MKPFRLLARVCACVCLAASSARAAMIAVPAGGNLQAAINDAQPGDTIALEAGAVYTGNFKLPAKNENGFITPFAPQAAEKYPGRESATRTALLVVGTELPSGVVGSPYATRSR